MTDLFEVGKEYRANDSGLPTIRILKRTEKTVLVWNGHTAWRMTIKRDENGNESVTDSSAPWKFRYEYTYQAGRRV